MNTTATPRAAANILVVDDMPENLQLLHEAFQAHGYDVRPVLSGEMALQVASLAPPDLILLDIKMPGMDGYETCERLKKDPQLAAVPVIFVSALGETFDKVRGFQLGAVDYVTKPFEILEVEARVRAHLELSFLRRQLEKYNVRLEEMVAERTHQLAESLSQLAESRERLAESHARLAVLDKAKDDFLHVISHEVRTPLTGIMGVTDLLLQECPAAIATEFSSLVAASQHRLMTLIEDALLFCQIDVDAESGSPPVCRLGSLLEAARSQARTFAERQSVELAPAPPGLGSVVGETANITRALQSLLETAVKFARPGTQIQISEETRNDQITLCFESHGQGIPPDALPRFFDLLGVAEAVTPGGDLGLGPALAQRIVSLYGGKVSVQNTEPAGIRLFVRLKTAEETVGTNEDQSCQPWKTVAIK
jgi:DNA-binding response OmpR family regulator